MTPLWLVAPALLVAASPFVGRALLRTAREVQQTQRAILRFRRELEHSAVGLGDAASGARASYERLWSRAAGSG